MPYSINRYNNAVLTVIADGTIDTSTDLKLIGKNYAGYGEVQNENFVSLLENFSGTTAPPRPLSGQVWFDSSVKKLKFYDNSKWRTTGGSEVSTSAPSGLTTGDFWWDNANNQLWTYNGSNFTLIGPQAAPGLGTTELRSESVTDNVSNVHAIIRAIIDGETVYIISADEFTLDNALNPIPGFSLIKKGLTLINTSSTGVTSSDHRYWGTASNALKLNGFSSGDFVLASSATFATVVNFSDLGYTLGNSNDLAVFIDIDGTTPVIKNSLSDTIKFQTTSGGTRTPLTLVGNDVLPGISATSNIGSALLKYATVYANSFNGTATKADQLNVGGSYYSASTAVSAGSISIAARDSNGDIYANVFNGTATQARFADLAELYLADFEYDTGTVLMIGGEKEVTASQVGFRAIGAVSKNPAHLMNAKLENGTIVALKGRIPVKVNGTVVKGQRLVAGPNGTAQAAGEHVDVFAIALETNLDQGVKLIEALIL